MTTMSKATAKKADEVSRPPAKSSTSPAEAIAVASASGRHHPCPAR
jgi:hypothetical protein